MTVKISQWRRGITNKPCYGFVSDQRGLLFRVEIYLLSNHNGTMFVTAEEVEKNFPMLLSGENIAGALAAFEAITETLSACQPKGECCPSCKSTEVDLHGRDGPHCYECGNTWSRK
jgi:hypothetical protein